MKAIDIHCHLHHIIKRGVKLNNILNHAEEKGVIAFIDSPVDVENYLQSIKNHKRFPNIFVTLGVAPAQYHELNIKQIIEQMKYHSEKNDIVAIGEVGLDYYWVKDHDLRKKQHETFQRFIDLANELQLPLVIHSRDAEDDTIEDLKTAEVPVIMHSFSGTVEAAQECVNRGYFISIPTSVTNRKKYRRLAKSVPLEHLLTETDSPYMSPFSEIKINEPGYVIYAVKEIAKLKEISEEEVARVTINNAKKIFKILS